MIVSSTNGSMIVYGQSAADDTLDPSWTEKISVVFCPPKTICQAACQSLHAPLSMFIFIPVFVRIVCVIIIGQSEKIR